MNMLKWCMTAATILILAATANAGPPAPKVTLEQATEVLNELETIKLKCIPPKLLEDAQAVAIIPRVIKGGFIIGGRVGHGVVLQRDDKGGWSQPLFVTIGGASLGFQVGLQSADVVLVFKKRDTLARLLEGKKKLTLGADISVAAGPVGREAAVATDGKLEAEIYSYSRARGLFAGVSLQGGVLAGNKDINEMYAADMRPETAKAFVDLVAKLNAMAK